MYFRQIFEPKLAQYAYLIGCQKTGEAIVIDPMRDVDVHLEIARTEGLRITAVAETHIHADFLSGARQLAERTGATVYVSGAGGNDWQSEWLAGSSHPHRKLRDGDHFMVGNIRFDAMHTPGHTPEHMCYLVTDTPAGASQPVGLISGDFVFVGDVGRPDLLETAAGETGAMAPAARTLFSSLARFRALNPSIQLWPGHGAGSACGKALGAVPVSTVGYELAANRALAMHDPDTFVAWVLEGQPEPPLYFARMKRDNRLGPPLLHAFPEPKLITATRLAELAGATGVAVIDTRSWDEYRHAHLPGSLFVPLDRSFNTVAGCYVPEKMPIVLIIPKARLREAVVDLIHVGLDAIIGYATPEMFREYARKGKVGTIEQIDPAGLDHEVASRKAFLLDVRRGSELAAFGQIPGAYNIAHTQLLARLAEVPRDRPIIVHCQMGSRSSFASGLLDRHGYRVINVAGGFAAWQAGGDVAASR